MRLADWNKDSAMAWMALFLAVACCVASVYLIEVRFTARKMQAKLDEVERFKTELLEQNRRYLIELSSFSDYSELHRRAMDEQKMLFPDYEDGTLVDLRRAENVVRPAEPGTVLAQR